MRGVKIQIFETRLHMKLYPVMVTTCSPMAGQLFDTMIVASSDKEWL